jgi:hypothetical protein
MNYISPTDAAKAAIETHADAMEIDELMAMSPRPRKPQSAPRKPRKPRKPQEEPRYTRTRPTGLQPKVYLVDYAVAASVLAAGEQAVSV